jgi:lipopolysaccharide export system protein LptA
MIPARLSLCLLATWAAGRAAAAPVTPVPTKITSEAAEIQSTDSETTSDFTGHVVVVGTNLRMTCDRLIVITRRVSDKSAAIGDPTGFKSLLAIGHVHMQQNDGLREADCGQAEVFPASDKIVLTREPVVIDRANGSRATGDVLELYKGQRKVTGKNVQISLPPVKDLGFDRGQKPQAPPDPLPAPVVTPPKSE